MLVVEMSAGQMLEDVRLAVQGSCPVEFYGRMGGVMPLPDEILEELRRISGIQSPQEDAGGIGDREGGIS
jgi:2-oxoglutarate ferredoxin oxidoreductase subunit alpha